MHTEPTNALGGSISAECNEASTSSTFNLGAWYRYGDSNAGPVAENRRGRWCIVSGLPSTMGSLANAELDTLGISPRDLGLTSYVRMEMSR